MIYWVCGNSIIFDKILNTNIISLFSFGMTMKYTPIKSSSNYLSFDVTCVNQISKLNKNFWNNNSDLSSKLIYVFT